MRFFFRRAKPKKNYLLALDIGTEFVKALIFKIENRKEGGKQALVIGFGRQRQMPLHMRAGTVTDIEGVALTCRSAIEEAATIARIRPTKAIIGIAGELVKGLTTTCLYQRTNPEEPIDLVEFKNLVQKIQWRAYQKVRRQMAWEICQPEVEIKLVNSLVTEVRIDGHQVTNPLGFQGSEVFLSIFNVYAPLIHLGALESIAAKLNLELISIAAEPYALTKASVFNPVSGAIFIDIGGGTTDIALVSRVGVRGTKSLALAGRAFTKRLAQVFGLGLSEAEEVKIKYSGRQLSQPVKRKIREILKKDIRVWLAGLDLVLEEFYSADSEAEEKGPKQIQPFPSLILLCGGGSLLPGIKTILEKEIIQKGWLKKFPFSQPPQVRFIQPIHINNIIDQTNILKGPADIAPMALASLALDIAADGENDLSSTMRRIVRIMR